MNNEIKKTNASENFFNIIGGIALLILAFWLFSKAYDNYQIYDKLKNFDNSVLGKVATAIGEESNKKDYLMKTIVFAVGGLFCLGGVGSCFNTNTNNQ